MINYMTTEQRDKNVHQLIKDFNRSHEEEGYFYASAQALVNALNELYNEVPAALPVITKEDLLYK